MATESQLPSATEPHSALPCQHPARLPASGPALQLPASCLALLLSACIAPCLDLQVDHKQLPVALLCCTRGCHAIVCVLSIEIHACLYLPRPSYRWMCPTCSLPWKASLRCAPAGITTLARVREEESVSLSTKWCSQFILRESVCNPDIELVCLSLRSFYLPIQEYFTMFCLYPTEWKGCKGSHLNCGL